MGTQVSFFVTKIEWDPDGDPIAGGFLVTLQVVPRKGAESDPRQTIVIPVSAVDQKGLFTWALTSTAALTFNLEYPSCLAEGMPE